MTNKPLLPKIVLEVYHTGRDHCFKYYGQNMVIPPHILSKFLRKIADHFDEVSVPNGPVEYEEIDLSKS